MAERERETIVTTDGGRSGGGAALAVVAAILLLIVVLFFLFGSNMFSGSETKKIDANVDVNLPSTGDKGS